MIHRFEVINGAILLDIVSNILTLFVRRSGGIRVWKSAQFGQQNAKGPDIVGLGSVGFVLREDPVSKSLF
jgi:hypothetical protein